MGIITRLLSDGTYLTNNYFDEVTLSANKVSRTAVYTSQLDEVTLKGTNVAKRETKDGRLLVKNYFDEVTKIITIGSTASTTTPSLVNSVTVGTTNGSPFSTSVNSYQFATQPSSAPFNYITVAGGSGFAVGLGDFTVEWFQYATGESASNTYPRIFWYGTGPSLGVSIEGTSSARVFYVWPAINAMANLTTNNQWVHFALVRISNKLYLYKNGTLVSIGSGVSNSTNVTDTTSTFYIGSKANTGLQSEQFVGSITSFRFVKGLGVYTGNFTVPTSPLGQTQEANPYGGSNTQAISAGQCSLLLNP